MFSPPRIPLSLCYAFSSLLVAPTLLFSNFTRPLFLASLGILSRHPYFSSSLFLCSPLSPSSFLHSFSPSPPAFLLRFSSPPPPFSLKVFVQSGSANVAAPFVAIAKSGRLPPCRAPLTWCRLWLSAIIERRSMFCPWFCITYIVPWITCCRFVLALSSPLQIAFLPSPHSWSSLFLSFVLLLHFTEEGGLVGPACDMLSGSSSCTRQFSHHSFTSTHLLNDFCLPPSSKLHLLITSHTSNLTLSNDTLHNVIYIFTVSFKKKKIKTLFIISFRTFLYSTHWLLFHFS